MHCVALQVMDRQKKEMIIWRGEINRAKKKARELHSLRCDMSYKLNVIPSLMPCTCLNCVADSLLHVLCGSLLQAHVPVCSCDCEPPHC